jgi:hypothetical protein
MIRTIIHMIMGFCLTVGGRCRSLASPADGRSAEL